MCVLRFLQRKTSFRSSFNQCAYAVHLMRSLFHSCSPYKPWLADIDTGISIIILTGKCLIKFTLFPLWNNSSVWLMILLLTYLPTHTVISIFTIQNANHNLKNLSNGLNTALWDLEVWNIFVVVVLRQGSPGCPGYHFVHQAGLETQLCLLLPSKCWD